MGAPWIQEAEIDAVMLTDPAEPRSRPRRAAGLRRTGIAYIAAGAFNGGLLARAVGEDARFNYRPAGPAVLAEHRQLSGLASSHGVSLKAAALQFVLRHPGVSPLVFGAARPAEEEDIRLAAIPIPEAFWAAAE